MKSYSIFESVLKRLLHESSQRDLALVVKDRGHHIDCALYDAQAMLDLLHRLSFSAPEDELMRSTKSAMRGFVRVAAPGRSLGDCAGAWEVSKIAGPGYGQILYSVAAALSPSGLIMTDRFVLSPAASSSFKKWSSSRESVLLPKQCITAPRAPGGTLDLGENPRKGLDSAKNPEHLNYAYRVSQEDENLLYDLTRAHFDMKRDDFVGELMNNYGADFFDDVMDEMLSK